MDFLAQLNGCIYICNQIVAFMSMETRRDIFQAIADPTRRAIIGLIAITAMTPGDLAAHFNTSRQAISKHIKVLVECEVVKQEVSGREIFYQLDINKMKEVDEWLEKYRCLWGKRFDQLENVLEKLKTKKK